MRRILLVRGARRFEWYTIWHVHFEVCALAILYPVYLIIPRRSVKSFNHRGSTFYCRWAMSTKLPTSMQRSDFATLPAIITASRIPIASYGTEAWTSDQIGFLAIEWYPTFRFSLGVYAVVFCLYDQHVYQTGWAGKVIYMTYASSAMPGPICDSPSDFTDLSVQAENRDYKIAIVAGDSG